jgi:methyl-accepting chemotaxis protein
VAEEISSAVDDVSDRAIVVSEEIAEIADENESQTEMVSRLTRQVEQIDRELAEVMDASV